MPTYQYECSACGFTFEKFQSMLDKKLRKCPECSKLKLHRLIGAGGGIIFKGTGFYETDFKRKPKPPVKEKGKSNTENQQAKPEKSTKKKEVATTGS